MPIPKAFDVFDSAKDGKIRPIDVLSPRKLIRGLDSKLEGGGRTVVGGAAASADLIRSNTVLHTDLQKILQKMGTNELTAPAALEQANQKLRDANMTFQFSNAGEMLDVTKRVETLREAAEEAASATGL